MPQLPQYLLQTKVQTRLANIKGLTGCLEPLDATIATISAGDEVSNSAGRHQGPDWMPRTLGCLCCHKTCWRRKFKLCWQTSRALTACLEPWDAIVAILSAGNEGSNSAGRHQGPDRMPRTLGFHSCHTICCRRRFKLCWSTSRA